VVWSQGRGGKSFYDSCKLENAPAKGDWSLGVILSARLSCSFLLFPFCDDTRKLWKELFI